MKDFILSHLSEQFDATHYICLENSESYYLKLKWYEIYDY